jgi:hypothetical protein
VKERGRAAPAYSLGRALMWTLSHDGLGGALVDGAGHAECWRASWAERGARPGGALAGKARWSFWRPLCRMVDRAASGSEALHTHKPTWHRSFQGTRIVLARHTTLPGRHRWASTSISMSVISDIDICYSDIKDKYVGLKNVIPILTSEFISDIRH